MRAALCLILALAATARAEPPAAPELYRLATTGATAEIRVDAAERLAIRFDRDADAREAALAAVLEGDAAVRAPLIQAMIDGGITTREAALHVPMHAALVTTLMKLDGRVRGGRCAIVPGNPNSVRVRCERIDRDQCAAYTITAEVWPRTKRVGQNIDAPGRCGCVCCRDPKPS